MSENTIERPDIAVPPLRIVERKANVEDGVSTIPLEFVFYAVLAALAFALRLLALNTPPRPEEVPDLLAAWRGTATASPALLWAQAISFDLMGGSIIAARLLTGFAGALLALSPVMFRAELGRTRALWLTLLLTVSAPMLIASRTGSAAVWTALVGVIALRLWLNHLRAPDAGRGIAAVVATAALLLIGDPSGIVMAILMAAGGALTYFWGEATAGSDVEAEADRTTIRAALRAVPWDRAAIIAALVVAAVTTGFMTAPSGLSSVGSLIGGVGGLFVPDGAAPGVQYVTENALTVSIYYQVLVWALAIAAIFVGRQNGFSAPDRFFIGWAGAGLLALILLPGLRSQHTILMAIPLCGLVSGLAAYCFAPDRRQRIFAEQQAADGDELGMLMSPPAGRLILTGVVFFLLCILTLHLQNVTREMLTVGDGSIGGVVQRMQTNAVSIEFRNGLLWTFISFMFILVGYFLAGSIWGNRVALQGYGLGFLALLLLTQLSGGWYVTGPDTNRAVEPWHHEATGSGYVLLEKTLDELAFREAQGFPLLPVTVVRDRSIGMTEDGLLGWLLRDYPNARFVDTLDEATAAPIVIAPDYSTEGDGTQPDLGGSYVGQRFILTRQWQTDMLTGFDSATWLMQRQVRIQPAARQQVALWIRMDVFDNLPIEDLLD